MKRYSAAVVGLGNVGLRYDLDVKNGERVTSHARAFASHPGYRLVGGVDPEEEGRRLLEQHYNVPAFPDIASLRSAGIEPDVWSISTPTALHATVFDEIVALRPAAILCEKPLADRVSDAERMVASAEACGCKVAVNYMRRFEPGVLALRKRIADGELGEIYKGVAWYSKGLLNNGSHVVDLLSFLLGAGGSIQMIQAGRTWGGYDPEPDICVCFGSARVMLLAAREECFSYCHIDLVGTAGMVSYMNGGHRIELRRTHVDPVLPGYTLLDEEAEVLPTDLKRYQWHSVDALYRHLEEGVDLGSSGSTALATLRIIDCTINALRNWKEAK
jgi:predicted dehydrogenase